MKDKSNFFLRHSIKNTQSKILNAQFPDQWTGRGRMTAWPQISPNLSPGYKKSVVVSRVSLNSRKVN
jgi:hypothetical protein